jgi:serine/threonine protein kinase
MKSVSSAFSGFAPSSVGDPSAASDIDGEGGGLNASFGRGNRKRSSVKIQSKVGKTELERSARSATEAYLLIRSNSKRATWKTDLVDDTVSFTPNPLQDIAAAQSELQSEEQVELEDSDGSLSPPSDYQSDEGDIFDGRSDKRTISATSTLSNRSSRGSSKSMTVPYSSTAMEDSLYSPLIMEQSTGEATQPGSATEIRAVEPLGGPFSIGPRRNSAPELGQLTLPDLSIPSMGSARDGALSRRRNLNLQSLVQPSIPTPKSAAKRSDEDGGYQTLKVIGRGSSSEVRKILHIETGKLYAGKVLMSSEGTEDKREMIQKEYDLLRSINHPNVVKVLELVVRETPQDELMMIVMKYLAGENLSNLIERKGGLDLCVVRSYTRQLTKALAYLHNRNVVHRDMKPENVMITELDHGEGARMLERARAVLIDFNVARTFDLNDEPMATCTGTPAFRSPEIMHGWEYDQSVDIWGLGAIVYASLAGRFDNRYALYTFHDKTDRQVLKEELQGATEPEFEELVWEDPNTEHARNFCCECLRIVANLRPVPTTLLNHPFLMGSAASGRKFERSISTLGRSNSRTSGPDEPLLEEFERETRKPGTSCPVPPKIERLTK